MRGPERAELDEEPKKKDGGTKRSIRGSVNHGGGLWKTASAGLCMEAFHSLNQP